MRLRVLRRVRHRRGHRRSKVPARLRTRRRCRRWRVASPVNNLIIWFFLLILAVFRCTSYPLLFSEYNCLWYLGTTTFDRY